MFAPKSQALQRVTPLDYAVVGYFIECVDASARTAAVGVIEDSVLVLESRWFASVVDYLGALCRLLSKLQPVNHAAIVAQSGEDWLRTGAFYLHFD